MKLLERLTVGLAAVATLINVSAAPTAAAEPNGTAIGPFRVKVPDTDIADLRRRPNSFFEQIKAE
jgi:hypothetical protein